MTVETVTSAILMKMPGIGKCQRRFMLHIVKLLLQLRGRANFTNMARYGAHVEQYYRKWFSRPFNFEEFNSQLIGLFAGTERILGFDPSFVPKSGNCTPGTGYFWSGCAKAVKWGMEICGIAVIDLSNHTSFHYEAVQTNYDKTKQALREYYAELIVQRAGALQKISKVIVFDAFFSKKGFVDSMCAAGFTMISRLQHNAYLRYRYNGPQKSGRGRPKLYGGRIDPKNVSTEHFREISRTEDQAIYEGPAHVRSLKRWAKLVIVQCIKDGEVTRALLYFSVSASSPKAGHGQPADAGQAPDAPEVSGRQIARYYPARFLMEFSFRDAKQHLGLAHCQSRQPQAVSFHFNIALTILNIIKAVHWLPMQQDARTPFSASDIKTQYSNQILLDKLISIYGKDPYIEKNNPQIKRLYDLGRIAA